MNWDAIGAVGEIAGALGVILSLVYLASQIRSQNTESRLAVVTEWTNQWNGWTASFADNPQLSELWVKGSWDFLSLNPAEAVQYSAHCGRFFRIAEGLHRQFSQGRLEDGAWRGLARTLEDMALLPGVKTWWTKRGLWYSDEFISFVQPLIDSKIPQRMYEPQPSPTASA
jgi:hypothetical protein